MKNEQKNRKNFKKGPQPGKKPYSEYTVQAKKQKVNMWGTHAVREAWLNPGRAIKAFYATTHALQGFEEVMEAARSAGIDRPQPQLTERMDLDRWLGEDTVHQGLAIDAEPLEEIFLQDLISRASTKEHAVFVMLDQVTDPHNIGAIMRTASAFGAEGIIMQTRHAPEITGVLAKAACGAVEHMPVAYETNLGRAVQLLQENGYTAVGLDERGPQTLAEAAPGNRVVIVLGAEGKGLRPGLRELCDRLARLPTSGAIQSLNVSNAAAVALYALMKA